MRDSVGGCLRCRALSVNTGMGYTRFLPMPGNEGAGCEGSGLPRSGSAGFSLHRGLASAELTLRQSDWRSFRCFYGVGLSRLCSVARARSADWMGTPRISLAISGESNTQ